MAPLRKLRRSIRRTIGFPHPSETNVVKLSPVKISELNIEQVMQHEQALKYDIAKGLAAIRRVLQCSDSEFRSRSFILETLLEFGMKNNPWQAMKPFALHINTSPFGIVQHPTEFVDFLMEILKHDINSAAEVGIWHGGASYFTAALLQRKNPDCVYTLIDIVDNLFAFDEFSKLLKFRKAMPNTSDDFTGEVFDYVFIDADHSYDGVKRDYSNLGQYARKLCAFHDIHAHEYDHLNGGTVRFWNEIRETQAQKHRIVEFAHSPYRWMGIGLMDKTLS